MNTGGESKSTSGVFLNCSTSFTDAGPSAELEAHQLQLIFLACLPSFYVGSGDLSPSLQHESSPEPKIKITKFYFGMSLEGL